MELGGADDVDAAGRVVRDVVRHAAEQEAAGAGHALVAHDDQVGLGLLGDVEDRVRRTALARVGQDLDAGLLRGAGRGFEDLVDVLLRADRVGDVRRNLVGLLAQACPPDRLEGADDVEAGARSGGRARSPGARPRRRFLSRLSRRRSDRTRTPSFAPDCARILSPRAPMPASWRYMMIVLVACLVASMVIAVVKLI